MTPFLSNSSLILRLIIYIRISFKKDQATQIKLIFYRSFSLFHHNFHQKNLKPLDKKSEGVAGWNSLYSPLK